MPAHASVVIRIKLLEQVPFSADLKDPAECMCLVLVV